MSIPNTLSAEILLAAQEVTTAVVMRQPGIQAALIATGDGFEVASEALEPETMSKLSAMSSSMVALADAIVREMKLKSGTNLVIEADLGRILMQGVAHANGVLLLTLVAGIDVSMNELSFAADHAAADLMIRLA